MKRETKDTILKVGLVLLYMIFFASFCVFLVGLLGGCSVYDWYKISEYLFMLVFPAGVVYFIFFFAWGGITEKKEKPDKFPARFDSYDDLECYLKSVLEKRGYSERPLLPLDEDGLVTVHIKDPLKKKMDVFTVIRVPELREPLFEQINDQLVKVLADYYNETRHPQKVEMISLVCVDRITSSFTSYVSQTATQGWTGNHFTAGISFGGKKIYMASRKSTKMLIYYMNLRKRFLGIMGLTEGDLLKENVRKEQS